MKKFLVIIDKVELKYFEFNKLVTNFWLIATLLKKNCNVYITVTPNLYLKGNKAYAKCYETYIDNENIFYKNILLDIEIDSFDTVLFRPDPPVDLDYINATYIFDFVNTKVINSPKTIRNFNEKLHSLYFCEYMSNSIVTCLEDEVIEFLYKYKQIILKPLNQCFGSGVIYLYDGDPNTHTLINTMTQNGSKLVMVQEFIPEVKNGDIRVLTLGDKILPYSIKKLPGKNDFKFNTHNDNYIINSGLSKKELDYFTPVAKKLHSMGIEMAGLDIINNKIIEINVTSPCYFIKEIDNIFDTNLENTLTDYILTHNLLSL